MTAESPCVRGHGWHTVRFVDEPDRPHPPKYNPPRIDWNVAKGSNVRVRFVRDRENTKCDCAELFEMHPDDNDKFCGMPTTRIICRRMLEMD